MYIYFIFTVRKQKPKVTTQKPTAAPTLAPTTAKPTPAPTAAPTAAPVAQQAVQQAVPVAIQPAQGTSPRDYLIIPIQLMDPDSHFTNYQPTLIGLAHARLPLAVNMALSLCYKIQLIVRLSRNKFKYAVLTTLYLIRQDCKSLSNHALLSSLSYSLTANHSSSE